MVRVGRAAVEVLLWLGLVAALSLLLVWWDVRPAAGAEHLPEVGDEGSLFAASFLLITSATTLFLWLRDLRPMARLAAAVSALALFLGGPPWGDIEEAEYVGLVLQVAGGLLLLLVLAPAVWQERASRLPLPGPLAIGLVLVFLPAAAYGLLVLGHAEVDAFPGPVVPALAGVAAVARVAVTDVARRRAPGHEN